MTILEETGHAGNSVTFQVKDNGIGMSEEQLEKIFNSFDQAETSTSKDYGGTGLGLAITKSFVEMMGGKIEVESKEKWGSHFKVTLPVNLQDDQTA